MKKLTRVLVLGLHRTWCAADEEAEDFARCDQNTDDGVNGVSRVVMLFVSGKCSRAGD